LSDQKTRTKDLSGDADTKVCGDAVLKNL